jgi:uncharacterized protein (TIGR02246 family)
MRYTLALISACACLILATPAVAQPQSSVSVQVEDVARRFIAAWNEHRLEKMDALVTDDIDWVNVDGGRGKGREQVVGGHVRVHATPKFKDSVMTLDKIEVASVRPDVAVAHVYWSLKGDRDNDGTPRQPRSGLFTWLLVKDGKAWRVRASHNSNKQQVR